MGAGIRVFFIEANDCVRRIPLERFKRLTRRGGSDERFPEYANQKIRYAWVDIETENRKPVSIEMIDGSFVRFNERGELDEEDFRRGARLVVEIVTSAVMASFTAPVKGGPIIDARRHFLRKQYFNEFRWQVNREMEKKIEEAIFGSKRVPLKAV